MKKPLFAAILLALAAPRARALRVETMPLPAGYRVAASTAPGAPPPTMLVASGRAIVRFSTAAPDEAAQNSALQSVGARVLSELPFGFTLVGLPPGVSVSSGLALLSGVKDISSIEPDRAYRPSDVTPNDPLFSQQYALANIDAPQGWAYGTDTGTAAQLVTIAMIDTGIDSTHSDLANKVLGTGSEYCPPGGGSCTPENPPVVACYHGTATSGVAAAQTNNSNGIAGVSWGAKLVSVRVFSTAACNSDCSDKGSSTCATDDATIVNALNYVATTLAGNSATYGRVVANMSLGEAGSCPPNDSTALNTAIGDNVVVTISAGNDGGAVNAPANCAGTTSSGGIIPVGATDSSDAIASFSSNGPELAANGVVAPGVNVETTNYPGGGYTGTASGTSFSAPEVAGLAALLRSLQPNATPAQIQSWIRGGAYNLGIDANHQGAGLINVYESMRLAAGSSVTTSQGPYAYPNPFRLAQDSSVRFNIPANLNGTNMDVRIYTVTGQLVRDLSAPL
ncbi:MAG: S8 family serine peptidase, partial [Elusimicrobia bacterium]|nr:S8 family serine peptidase [Elusimicrobiota bacterium]